MSDDKLAHIRPSNFVETFCLPVICAMTSMTMLNLVTTATAANIFAEHLLLRRSFGQWVALIFLSAITLGIIWAVAYAIVLHGRKKDGSAINLLFAAASGSLVAAEPKEPKTVTATTDLDELMKLFFISSNGNPPEFKQARQSIVAVINDFGFAHSRDGNCFAAAFYGSLTPDLEGESTANQSIADLIKFVVDLHGGEVTLSDAWNTHTTERDAFIRAFRRDTLLDLCDDKICKLRTGIEFQIYAASNTILKGDAAQRIAHDIEEATIAILKENDLSSDEENKEIATIVGEYCDFILRNKVINSLFIWVASGKNERMKIDMLSAIDLAAKMGSLTYHIKSRYADGSHDGKIGAACEAIEACISKALKNFALEEFENEKVEYSDPLAAEPSGDTCCGKFILGQVAENDELAYCLRRLITLAEAKYKLENQPLPAQDSTKPAEQKLQNVELSDFTRVFAYPLARRRAQSITGTAIAISAATKKLSFGDWTALICLSLVTLGIIWLCAYICARIQLSNGNSALWKLIMAGRKPPAAAPTPDIVELTKHFFEESSDGDDKFSPAESTFALCRKINFGEVFVGSNGILRTSSANGVSISNGDTRNSDEIISDFLDAIGVDVHSRKNIRLAVGVDPIKERETWNLFVEKFYRFHQLTFMAEKAIDGFEQASRRLSKRIEDGDKIARNFKNSTEGIARHCAALLLSHLGDDDVVDEEHKARVDELTAKISDRISNNDLFAYAIAEKVKLKHLCLQMATATGGVFRPFPAAILDAILDSEKVRELVVGKDGEPKQDKNQKAAKIDRLIEAVECVAKEMAAKLKDALDPFLDAECAVKVDGKTTERTTLRKFIDGELDIDKPDGIATEQVSIALEKVSQYCDELLPNHFLIAMRLDEELFGES
ncbi:MAG: hypothetical protein LBB38_03200 [Puniceicoccales bacterium]|jgi:hypothetical protein|nr:hypothetical protein [Puniceicoccales bacterium]